MSKHDEELAAIDPDMLAAVTGGAARVDEQVTTMLQSLMSSIKDLASAKQNSGGDFMSQMMPMMMMMMNRSSAASATPAPAAAACPCASTGGGDGWIQVR